MNLTHRRKHYVRGVGSRCPWEMQQIQPLFPSEFLGTDSDHGQHGKMLLGEASLVYWFMNRYHQDCYGNLARCLPYWKGKRRAKSSHSDQRGLVEKACLFLRHPPLLPQSKLLACSVPRLNSFTKPSQIFQEAPAAPSPEFLCSVFT